MHIVNQASAFVQRIFCWRTADADGKVDQPQFHKAKCSIYLYYRCALSQGASTPLVVSKQPHHARLTYFRPSPRTCGLHRV